MQIEHTTPNIEYEKPELIEINLLIESAKGTYGWDGGGDEPGLPQLGKGA